jgi:hypothetical protein
MMKKELTEVEPNDKDAKYKSELRKARWCGIAGKGVAIAPLVAAGVLSHTTKMEHSTVMMRVDADMVAGMVAVLGWAIGKNRSVERAEAALQNYYKPTDNPPGNT